MYPELSAYMVSVQERYLPELSWSTQRHNSGARPIITLCLYFTSFVLARIILSFSSNIGQMIQNVYLSTEIIQNLTKK